MKNYSILTLICLLFTGTLTSQMLYNGKFQFGNEWINHSQSYYKFRISQDGLYRISTQDLENAGIPTQNVEAKHFQMFRNGQEVYLITSTESILGNGDFMIFYATKNHGYMDASLFKSNVPLFNSEYSMFTDTSAYYLTWNSNVIGLRYELKENDNTNPLAKELSYIHKEKIILSEFPTKRAHGTHKSLKLPDFDEGQGYGTGYFSERTFNLDFKNPYTFGNDAQVNIKVFGEGSGDGTLHEVNFYTDNEFMSKIVFTGYKVKEGIVKIPAEKLINRITLKVLANGQIEDKVSVSTIAYQYEAEYKFDHQNFANIYVAPSLTRKTIVIEDFDGGAELLLWDLDNHFYIKSSRQANGSYPINLPASDSERHLLILNQNVFSSISGISEVKMEDYKSEDYNYLILTSKNLTLTAQNSVDDYLNYRTSKEGGSYKVKLVYKEDIEEEFGFGIKGHSIAYRNFFQYSKSIWPQMKYVLLVGKGLEYEIYRNDPQYNEWNIIPTYSEPASDYLLVCDSLRIPFYTIGRIPVLNNQELSDYLNKVKVHESYLSTSSYNINNREWLKKIVHLAGGDPTLYATLRSQLAGMESEIETNPYGADVETFYKESTSSVEVINSEKLSNLINNGVSIISFMGHSISFRLDFNIDNINDYRNKDKYHMFVAMGCYAGQMFLNNRSISETQNLAADKGSIIYLSNTSAGLPGILYKFGQDFYSQLGGKYYGEPVGDAVREVFNNLIASNGQESIYQALSTSFNGDPVLRLNNNKEIDLTLDGETAKSKEPVIYADQKNFDFKIDIVNLGYYLKDSVKVRIENIYPDGSKFPVFVGNVSIPNSRGNYTFVIPINENKSVGSNKLLVSLDPDNAIKEGPLPIAEGNNNLITLNNQEGYSYFVIGNNAKPLYPAEFAIINEEKPSLVAYNGNTFAKNSNYYLELDTTEFFNSPIKKNKEIFQTGGVINWKLEESLQPNQVYYWRIRPDSSGSSILAWKNSSFIYMPGKQIGWNQSHVFQHMKNTLNGIQITESKRSFEYKDIIIEFAALNGYIELPTFIRPKVFLGSSVEADYRYWEFRNDLSGMVVAFLNPLTGQLVTNSTGSDFESIGGSSMAGSNYFLFATDTKENRAKLINFLKNDIPDQAVVIVESLIQYNYSLNIEQWESDGSDNLLSLFKSYGAKSIDQFVAAGSVPYALIYGKNRQGYETRDRVGNLTDELDLKHSITIKLKQSVVESKLVGPAASYDKFLWDYNQYDSNTDQQSIEIYGVELSGIETKLFGPVSDAEIDLKSIDAKIYPSLKLVWKTSDETNRTPPNMNYWRVFYTGLPDIAFSPAFNYKKNFDTLNQGTIFKLELASQNVSIYNMDSLLIKFKLLDQRNIMIESEVRYMPINAFAYLKFPFEIKTTKQAGPYKLIIELNPNQDQSEFVTFNNTALVNYYVRKDKRKAKLRIAFNGQVINNGDIVSTQSQISILLHDENNSIPMDDPNLFSIKIKTPDGNLIEIDPSKQNNVHFIPANGNGNTNEASIIIDGDFQQNGSYYLIVRAKDANGNFVAETEENVEFKIVKESSISNVFNYPNPFSTKTKFIYTLTGAKSPTFFKIQIMTISGKIIRELDQNELGPLNIGTHMTEFEYDGTDQFGQKLANGVYLYRAIFKDENGADIKKLDTNTDKFFVNNYGKMVILR